MKELFNRIKTDHLPHRGARDNRERTIRLAGALCLALLGVVFVLVAVGVLP